MDIKKIVIALIWLSTSVYAQDAQVVKNAQDFEKIQPSQQQREMINNALKSSKNFDISNIETILKSEAYQTRSHNYANRVREVLNINPQSLSNEQSNSDDKGNYIGDRLVLFVSSSMPIDILRKYVKDLNKIGGVMIFRGTLDGIDSMKPTMQFMRTLLLKDPSCNQLSCETVDANISIDPDRFTHHSINKVPALIFEKDMKIQAYCEQGDKGEIAPFVIYGDASLLGLTQTLYQHQPTRGLKTILNELRGIKS